MDVDTPQTIEHKRLREDASREKNWKRWGPYISERQWGSVREDYSADGSCWTYLPHDHARSRAYRWGEDGLLGITDRECRLCFSLAMWNGKDPILKERLFGLTGPEGNHGEDVKECYYYIDSTPTHSYMKALYKYPQQEFPYTKLVEVNAHRGKSEPEYELIDTGVFDDNRYFDIFAEYAKSSPNDLLIRFTVANRGTAAAEIHLLPTLWFRNTWTWGCSHEGCGIRPQVAAAGKNAVIADHPTLGRYRLELDPHLEARAEWIFTENNTNEERLFTSPNPSPYVKDSFDRYIVHGETGAVNPAKRGTKAGAHLKLTIPAHSEVTVRLRLFDVNEGPTKLFGEAFDRVFQERVREADAFYSAVVSSNITPEERRVTRQAFAGLLWSKQFYHYIVEDWLKGDADEPPPPAARWNGRNRDWKHLYNRDVISMPDKWEYPWYAAWDLAFHMVAFARIDPEFSKSQLILLLREWYMHPNGQLPAYEFCLGDVNPPVHAWACWRVYKLTGPRGKRDRLFLARAFQKLLINFTWWVNRKDIDGRHLFAGGFLGLDNIGVFDRSKPLPSGHSLDQADGTAWMAFFCATMLAMALELAMEDPSYEDVASKFFEHFIAIADAMNTLGGTGLWDEHDGFYYDQLKTDGTSLPMRIRSMVGIIPLFTAEVLEEDVISRLSGFLKRTKWFLENRKDLSPQISYMESNRQHRLLLAIPSRDRLQRVLKYVLDENEFLSPHGVRSLSRIHKDRPYTLKLDGETYCVKYVPAESDTSLFGGNSNWRGPIWFPVNYLLVETLQRYHYFYGDTFQIECPTGSGNKMNLQQVAMELTGRLASIFLPDESGRRPCHGTDARYAEDPHWRDLILFHEYFDGDNGRGVGASHQTGWTAMVAKMLHDMAAHLEKAGVTRTPSGVATVT